MVSPIVWSPALARSTGVEHAALARRIAANIGKLPELLRGPET
jgi:hypothetical protein